MRSSSSSSCRPATNTPKGFHPYFSSLDPFSGVALYALVVGSSQPCRCRRHSKVYHHPASALDSKIRSTDAGIRMDRSLAHNNQQPTNNPTNNKHHHGRQGGCCGSDCRVPDLCRPSVASRVANRPTIRRRNCPGIEGLQRSREPAPPPRAIGPSRFGSPKSLLPGRIRSGQHHFGSCGNGISRGTDHPRSRELLFQTNPVLGARFGNQAGQGEKGGGTLGIIIVDPARIIQANWKVTTKAQNSLEQMTY
mmetsp:Transcript_19551/g.53830  ORF Transcript_19551/g.53830 Transcript_19551/m.53830 type:complete len:250 (+) Transcript_19551:4074-4823(+)